MKSFNVYWGDMHHNTYQHHIQDPPLDEVLAFASQHLDFYTGAYYTPVFDMVPPKPKVIRRAQEKQIAPQGGHLSEQTQGEQRYRGVHLEHIKDPESLEQEWAEFQKVTDSWNRPGEFVAFPGYEWQGNGRWGDHNVVQKHEGDPIHTVDTLAELYERIRDTETIAIPHHTGYLPGQRAPIWAACDDQISPFAEIYSVHGCSETDEEWIGLRNNPHMGPGVGGATYQEALDLGLHLGAICSTDNWTNMPAHWGQGIAACLAQELSREALWEAFLNRRMYGVTGDRIQLDFQCNGAAMGSILPHTKERNLLIHVQGLDALDRIELLRNGQVIATHCHQGTWQLPTPGQRTRWALRIEAGWGPFSNELPIPQHQWRGQLSVRGGRMLDWSPCWVTRGQSVPHLQGDSVEFQMISRQDYVNKPMQGANVFLFEAAPEAEVILKINGLSLRKPLRRLGQRSHLFWYKEKSIQNVQEMTGVQPKDVQREDVYYHMAHKAKIHRAIPQEGYTATLEITDNVPLTQKAHYRVRVEQRNGQRAWSSPIWIEAPL